VQKAYDFMLWMLPHTAKYARNYKYTLGSEVQRYTLLVLERLVEASYTRSKIDLLQEANTKLEVLRYLLRSSCDLQCISIRQYECAIKMLYNLGVEVGGWLKEQRGKAN